MTILRGVFAGLMFHCVSALPRNIRKKLNGIQEVGGSIPLSSTNKIKHLASIRHNVAND